MVKSHYITNIKISIEREVVLAVTLLVIANLLFGNNIFAKDFEITDKQVDAIKGGLDLTKILVNIAISDDKLKTVLNNTIRTGKAGTDITYGLFVLSAMNEMELIDMVLSQRYKFEATEYFNGIIDERTNLVSYWKGVGVDLPRVFSSNTPGPISALTLNSFEIENKIIEIFIALNVHRQEKLYDGLYMYFDLREGNDSHEEAWRFATYQMRGGLVPVITTPFDSDKTKEKYKDIEAQFAELWDKWGPYVERVGEYGTGPIRLTEAAKRQFREEMGQMVLEAVGQQELAEKEKDVSLIEKILGYLSDKAYSFVSNAWNTIKKTVSQVSTLGGAKVGQVIEITPRETVPRPDLGTVLEEVEEEEEIGQEEEPAEPDPQTLAELQRQINEAAKMVEALNLQVLGLIEAQEELEEFDEDEEEFDELEEKVAEKQNEVCSVNINTASKEELQKITGVGPVISQRIIEARPFSSLSELDTKVKGIGPVTLQKIIDQGCAYLVSTPATSSGAVSTSPPKEGQDEEEEDTTSKTVIINEIAWMGTTAATSDEWIELYNTTKSSVGLTGWKLVSADGSPDIALTGTISALGFYLLERTASTTTDVTEDQTYTGALNNNPNCEVLELHDQNNNLIDKTVCLDSGNWPAGDNSTKQTMERINPRTSGQNSSNWQNNNGITINGLDANGNQIKGTPRAQNSAYQTLTPDKVENFALDSQNSYSDKASLTWATSTDSDTLSENLSYKIYYTKQGELTESNLNDANTSTATTTQISITISNLDYSSTYYFGIKAYDPENNFSGLATTTSYKTATLSTIASGFPSNLGSADVPHNGRNLVRTSNGNLYAVYDRSGSAHKVYLASSTDSGITWSESEITSDQDQINPSIAVDSQNNLHIAWQGLVGTSTEYQIRYTKYDGNSFSTIENFTTDETKDQEIPVIAVDSQNKVHLAWVGRGLVASSTGDSLYYVKNSGGTWGSVETVKAGEFHSTFGKSSLTQFALALDTQDILHFVWFESPPADADSLRYRKVDPSIDSGSWSAFENLTNVSNLTQSSVAVDSQDNLHIVWHQPSSGNSIIKYLKCSGTCDTSDIETLDEETNNLIVAYPSIAADSNNNLYVVWKRWTTKPLSQIEYKSGAWQSVKDLISDFSSQGFPNALWSINNKPTTGYAFVFYKDTELKFYGSEDLTW